MSSAAPHLRRPGTGDLVRLVRGLGVRARRPVTTALLAALSRPLGSVSGDGHARAAVALRVDGRDRAPTPEALRALARDGSGRVLVLVPGAAGDERAWQRGVEQTGATYGDRLAALLGWSPVALRYDGGDDLTGAALTLGALLQDVVDGWPVPVTRVVLVAAGDGGLLARGALGLRQPGPRPWTGLVTELVALGTPSRGVPVPDARREASGVGRLLEQELAGVVLVRPEAVDVPAPDHVRHLLIGSCAATRPHPVGRALGTLLRRRQRSRRVYDLFPSAERLEVRTHVHPLVNHPEIHEALIRRLA